MIKAEYHLSKNEYISFMMKYTLKKPLYLFIFLISLLLLIFSLRDIFIGQYYFVSRFQNQYVNWILMIYLLIGMPLTLYYRFKKFYNTHQLLGKQTVTQISEKGIEENIEGFEVKILWENIYKVKELKDFFLFYQSSTAFGFLPKRVLSKEQIKELREVLQNNNIKSELLES